MRHRVVGKKLNRDKDHRQALMKNLAASLLINGKIETTLVKAKFIRPFVEKLITKAKDNSYNSLRLLRTRLTDEVALDKLFSDIAPSYKERNGGYTRITRTGKIRKGDNSELATIELIESRPSKTENKLEENEENK
jgi:large subunit ribosomal protein L17